MPLIADSAFDAALAVVQGATVLHICSSEPASFAAVDGVSLGTKATPTFTGPAAGDVSGRKVTVDAITDGSVTATGTASHFALVNASVLLAAGALATSQAVTSGNTFTLTAFDIEFPQPA